MKTTTENTAADRIKEAERRGQAHTGKARMLADIAVCCALPGCALLLSEGFSALACCVSGAGAAVSVCLWWRAVVHLAGARAALRDILNIRYEQA